MGNIDTDGDGRIDMRIEDTAHGLSRLRGNADALKAELNAAFAEVQRLSVLVDQDGKVSEQFMAQYEPWRGAVGPVSSAHDEPGLEQGVQEVPVNYHKLADSGDAAVAKYREAEQNAVNQFRS